MGTALYDWWKLVGKKGSKVDSTMYPKHQVSKAMSGICEGVPQLTGAPGIPSEAAKGYG